MALNLFKLSLVNFPVSLSNCTFVSTSPSSLDITEEKTSHDYQPSNCVVTLLVVAYDQQLNTRGDLEYQLPSSVAGLTWVVLCLINKVIYSEKPVAYRRRWYYYTMPSLFLVTRICREKWPHFLASKYGATKVNSHFSF